MKHILIPALVALLPLTGCISDPAGGALKDASYSDIRSNLKKGRTTKDQVRATFGKPRSVQSNNGQETWIYYSSTIGLGVIAGQIQNIKSLTIMFVGEVVKDYNYSTQGS